jgi:hypothetical protein
MRESTVERYLVQRVEALGGTAEKFKSPNNRNVPDRICSWPFGYVDFVELKATGVKPNAAQLRDHKRRRALGHEVYVLDSIESVLDYAEFALRREGDKRRSGE